MQLQLQLGGAGAGRVLGFRGGDVALDTTTAIGALTMGVPRGERLTHGARDILRRVAIGVGDMLQLGGLMLTAPRRESHGFGGEVAESDHQDGGPA